MAESLVLKFDPGSDLAQWIVVDDRGGRRGPPVSGPLSAARVDLGDRALIVLVPASEVLTTAVDMPVKSAAKIQQALPFALEEYVAEDVEDLHFAAGVRNDNGRVPVAVINREKFESWLATLADAGLHADAIMAENYGLAVIPGTISMLLDGDQVFINDGDEVSLVMQDLGPGEALQAIGAMDEFETDKDSDESAREELAPPRHVLVYTDAHNQDRHAAQLEVLRHDFTSLDVKVLPDGVLPRLAVTVAAGAGVNFLQGTFGARKEYGSLLRPWRYAAALFLALAVSLFAVQGLKTFKLKQQEADLSSQFLAEYQEIAPGTEEVRDPDAVIQSLINRTRGGSGSAPSVFLASLSELSKAVEANDAAKLDAISYRAGVIDVRLSAPSVAVLDNIQRSIDESGRFEADIQSTTQDDDVVDSRIQIRESRR